MTATVERRPAVVLAADLADSTGHLQADEVAAVLAMRQGRQILRDVIAAHGGRIANTAGDGLIAELPDAGAAIGCALEAQAALAGRRGPGGRALAYRFGLHAGDVVVEGTDLIGETVHLAARLQAWAEPGGILASEAVRGAAPDAASFEALGPARPRNFGADVAVFRVLPPGRRLRAAFPVPTRRWLLGLALGLVALDLLTPGPAWSPFPLLFLATLAAWRTAPRLAEPWLGPREVRLAVLLLALVILNLLTWNGALWSVWPLAAALVAWVVGRLLPRLR